MKILLLVKNFDFGGAENHVCELANALVENGQQVWLFSGSGRQLKRLSPKVVCLQAKITDWNMLPLLFRLLLLIRKEQIQLLHAHQRLPIWLATLAGFFTGTKVAGTVHGTASHDIRSGFVKRNLDGIIVISRNSYDIHSRNPKLRNKLYFLPNFFKIPVNLESNKTDSTAFNLFYVSRQDQRHANLLTDIILNVWPRFLMKHPGSTFYLVGDGCGSEKIGRILGNNHAPPWVDSIVCEGYVEEVASCLAKAHLVMGVGRVVGESLGLGIPALSIKWNHLGPIVRRENFEELSYANFVSLEAPPPDPERLLSILDEFMDHAAYYQEEANFLRNTVAQKFDIREGIHQTLAVYNELINNSKGNPNHHPPSPLPAPPLS
jgi:glycosyltransferase involved in cell wall biosynthesis